jgi:hypothetical protein
LWRKTCLRMELDLHKCIFLLNKKHLQQKSWV